MGCFYCRSLPVGLHRTSHARTAARTASSLARSNLPTGRSALSDISHARVSAVDSRSGRRVRPAATDSALSNPSSLAPSAPQMSGKSTPGLTPCASNTSTGTSNALRRAKRGARGDHGVEGRRLARNVEDSLLVVFKQLEREGAKVARIDLLHRCLRNVGNEHLAGTRTG